jgi:hypothetical protein
MIIIIKTMICFSLSCFKKCIDANCVLLIYLKNVKSTCINLIYPLDIFKLIPILPETYINNFHKLNVFKLICEQLKAQLQK